MPSFIGLIASGQFGHFGAIFGHELKFVADYSCDHSKRLQEERKSDGDGFGSHFENVEVIFSNFRIVLGPFRDHLGPICGPNSNLSENSHVTTHNSRILMEMVFGQNPGK